MANSGYSQITTVNGAGISARIIEPVSISRNDAADANNVAIMLIISPLDNGVNTSATYYYTHKSDYIYSDATPNTPLIIRNSTSTLQVASFVNNPALASQSKLIAGVYVSVTPSSITVNYN